MSRPMKRIANPTFSGKMRNRDVRRAFASVKRRIVPRNGLISNDEELSGTLASTCVAS